MNCLVTGGAGFIGSHIVDALVQIKNQVSVVDNLISGNRAQVNKRARFVEMDISSPNLERVFKEEQFEVVFHLAAQTSK